MNYRRRNPDYRGLSEGGTDNNGYLKQSWKDGYV